ncbi:MAG: DUF3060 domain-containing protein [Mycolicibacterium sp.]|nr:DUF3060 domain-containing protein [Mycolicibacterium sp.]
MRRSFAGVAVTCSALVVSAAAVTGVALTRPAPAAAKNGDTHITSMGSVQTIDCNDATLFVNGANNTITALGSCWAVTSQGSNNTVIADNVVNDITVYGSGNTVLYKSGQPFVVDHGRELGMTNVINQISD